MAHVPNDITQAFFAGRKTALVRFSINDSVVITDGPHRGRKGAVVVLRSIEPCVEYTVETDETPSKDIIVAQDSIMLLATNS